MIILKNVRQHLDLSFVVEVIGSFIYTDIQIFGVGNIFVTF